MGRVNIEERCLVMAKKLARIMGWTKYDAVGRLAYLFHDSQELLLKAAPKEDILEWIGMYGAAESDVAFQALLDVGFIRPEKRLPGLYRIRGNREHVDNLRKLRVASKKGGEATRKKWKGERPKQVPETSPPLNARPQGQPEGIASSQASSRAQYSAVQFSAVQSSTVQGNSSAQPSALPQSASPGGHVFSAEEFERCLTEYQKTLDHFEIRLQAKTDEVSLYRLVQLKGVERTILALKGARTEPKFDGFDPKDYFSLRRLSDPRKFDEAVNRGARPDPEDPETSQELEEFERELERLEKGLDSRSGDDVA